MWVTYICPKFGTEWGVHIYYSKWMLRLLFNIPWPEFGQSPPDKIPGPVKTPYRPIQNQPPVKTPGQDIMCNLGLGLWSKPGLTPWLGPYHRFALELICFGFRLSILSTTKTGEDLTAILLF